MTDAELLQQHRNGSETAFAELVRRHVNWVYAVARRCVGDSHLAEDATQAAFVILWRKAPRLKAGQALSPWLFPAVNFMCKRVLRAEYRRRRRECEAAKMRDQAIHDPSSEWAELAPLLDDLVGRLESDDRQAILLRFYEQKSFPEIGQALRISEEAARKRVSRAVEQLRGDFARRGVTVSAAALTTTIAVNIAPPASASVMAGASAITSITGLPALAGGWQTFFAWNFKPIALAAASIIVVIVAVTAMQLTGDGPNTVVAAPTTALALSPATRPVDLNIRRGRIIDEQRRPIAAARVMLVTFDEARLGRIEALTQSDADGQFEIRRLSEKDYLLVRSPGYGLTAQYAYGFGEEEISIRSAASMKLRFVKSDGTPATGVRVAPMELLPRDLSLSVFLPEELKPEMAQTTDADGVCILTGLPQDMSLKIETLDDRFALYAAPQWYDQLERRIPLGDTAETDGGTIQLDPGGSIAGRVVIADTGAPVPGVWVRASGWSVRTDAQGRYQINRLPSNSFTLTVDLGDELSAQYAAAGLQTVNTIPGGVRDGQDFRLIRGGLIRGRITAEQTSQPVSGVVIYLTGPSRPSGAVPQTVNVKPDGTYAVRVPPGNQNVIISARMRLEGFLRPQEPIKEVTVAEGQTETVDFAMPPNPAPPVKGRVVNQQGQPVAGVQVTAWPRGEIIAEPPFAITDRDGNFNISGIEDGSVVRARKGTAGTLEPVAVRDDNRHQLSLVLSDNSMSAVTVRVTGPDGAPLAGAQAEIREIMTEGTVRRQRKNTDAEGKVVFHGLYSDYTHLVMTQAKGYGKANARFKVRPGEQIEGPTLALPKADSFIAGIVLDENGDPLVEALIEVFGVSPTTRTDINGRFRVEELVPGEQYTLSIRPDRQPSESHRIVAGTSNAVINYKPPQPSQR